MAASLIPTQVGHKAEAQYSPVQSYASRSPVISVCLDLDNCLGLHGDTLFWWWWGNRKENPGLISLSCDLAAHTAVQTQGKGWIHFQEVFVVKLMW